MLNASNCLKFCGFLEVTIYKSKTYNLFLNFYYITYIVFVKYISTLLYVMKKAL